MKLFDEFEGITCDGAILSDGFIQVPIKILLDDRLSPGAVHAYCLLLWYNFRSLPYPGHKQASIDFPIPERSLRRYINQLIAAGHLQTFRRGRGQPNLYYLPQPQLDILPADEPEADRPRADARRQAVRTHVQ